MKKIFLMALATLMFSTTTMAKDDEPKNEIGIFYGFGSASDLLSYLGAAFSYSTGTQTNYWGPFGVEYYRHLTPVIAVGGSFELAGCKWDKPNYTSGYLKTHYMSIMPSVKFNWLRKKYFGLYSGLSAGVMIATLREAKMAVADPTYENENIAAFMFHANVIGLEAGTCVRGFAELGFGEKGLFTVGVRYKF